jgi:hypothetical protein
MEFHTFGIWGLYAPYQAPLELKLPMKKRFSLLAGAARTKTEGFKLAKHINRLAPHLGHNKIHPDSALLGSFTNAKSLVTKSVDTGPRSNTIDRTRTVGKTRRRSSMGGETRAKTLNRSIFQ